MIDEVLMLVPLDRDDMRPRPDFRHARPAHVDDLIAWLASRPDVAAEVARRLDGAHRERLATPPADDLVRALASCRVDTTTFRSPSPSGLEQLARVQAALASVSAENGCGSCGEVGAHHPECRIIRAFGDAGAT